MVQTVSTEKVPGNRQPDTCIHCPGDRRTAGSTRNRMPDSHETYQIYQAISLGFTKIQNIYSYFSTGKSNDGPGIIPHSNSFELIDRNSALLKHTAFPSAVISLPIVHPCYSLYADTLSQPTQDTERYYIVERTQD